MSKGEMMMKKTGIFFVGLVLFYGVVSTAEPVIREIPREQVEAAVARAEREHPRLFLTDEAAARVRRWMKQEPELKAYYRGVVAKAERFLDARPLARKKTGRRLLGVSRDFLERMSFLGTAYRFSGDERYLWRAEKEMLAVAAFSDWNPSHFLDVAEMTAGMAIGYDWLYHDLPPESREIVRQAIMEKGVVPSLKSGGGNWWIEGENNWNQVCHGGITMGVLAVMEDEREMAVRVVHRAVNKVQIAMHEYEPDGVYPEGPGYWGYGTTYNVLLLAALESALGTEFGLSQKEGFSQGPYYYLHVTGPSGDYFNYPDSGLHKSFMPVVYWFAREYDDPSLSWTENRMLDQALKSGSGSIYRHRIAPLMLLWYTGEGEVPEARCWMGRGSNGVAMFRTSWIDPGAAYLAIKGGSPGVNHGHMDVGTFVYEAEGVRWALDLGKENYHKIESRGMKLWGKRQDAQRWTIFRYNNFSHNTLVVNGKMQRVKGTAPIVRFSDEPAFSHVVYDMSRVYEGQLNEVHRGGAMLPNGAVLIQDDVQAGDEPTPIRWAMVTPAEVEMRSAKQAILREQGKMLHFEVLGEVKTKLQTYSTKGPAEYDEPNPGTRMIGFEVVLAPQEKASLAVLMTPGRGKAEKRPDVRPLREWSEPRAQEQ